MKEVKKAGWAAPKDHPDVEPKHEAIILAEAFREMLRTDEVAKKSDDFRARLAESERLSWDLAGVLDEPKPDAIRARDLYDRIDATCVSCHKAYRDAK
jgi:cytochrome c556